MYRNRGKTLFIWIFILIVLLLFAGGVLMWVMDTYTVKNVYVEGNYHYTQEEIKEIVMEGPLGNNSLYLRMKYKSKGVDHIPFVDTMDVSILSPDTIKITVYEKILAGYVEYLDTYMYFDKDGYLVECSGVKTLGVPQVAGITFNHALLGEPLPVEDKGIFDRILSLTKLVGKYELAADKIFFHSGGKVTVYFGDIKVALGSETKNLEDRFMLLHGFLKELEGKKGTLQMENYNPDNGRYTFQPDS